MEEHGHKNEMSKDGNVYGSCLLAEFRQWEWTEWIETIPPFKLDPKTPFGSILVPTTDTIRYSHLVRLLVNTNKHVLAVGNTGISPCPCLLVLSNLMVQASSFSEAHSALLAEGLTRVSATCRHGQDACNHGSTSEWYGQRV